MNDWRTRSAVVAILSLASFAGCIDGDPNLDRRSFGPAPAVAAGSSERGVCSGREEQPSSESMPIAMEPAPELVEEVSADPVPLPEPDARPSRLPLGEIVRIDARQPTRYVARAPDESRSLFVGIRPAPEAVVVGGDLAAPLRADPDFACYHIAPPDDPEAAELVIDPGERSVVVLGVLDSADDSMSAPRGRFPGPHVLDALAARSGACPAVIGVDGTGWMGLPLDAARAGGPEACRSLESTDSIRACVASILSEWSTCFASATGSVASATSALEIYLDPGSAARFLADAKLQDCAAVRGAQVSSRGRAAARAVTEALFATAGPSTPSPSEGRKHHDAQLVRELRRSCAGKALIEAVSLAGHDPSVAIGLMAQGIAREVRRETGVPVVPEDATLLQAARQLDTLPRFACDPVAATMAMIDDWSEAIGRRLGPSFHEQIGSAGPPRRGELEPWLADRFPLLHAGGRRALTGLTVPSHPSGTSSSRRTAQDDARRLPREAVSDIGEPGVH